MLFTARTHLPLALLALFAVSCGGEPTAGIEEEEDISTTEDALVATCNLRDPASCLRGESCLSLGAGDFCTTGRCLDVSDCGRGYTCRANHCLRLEAPQRDRCASTRPLARGTCRTALGWFWDGRVCVGLTGCAVTNSEGLFRTARECSAAFELCDGR